MTRFRRTILFFSFVIIFIILVPAILLYSKGYRIDWDEKRLALVGGLFLKTSESGAKIFINDEFRKETDLFLKRAFIPNLLPKDYNIKIKKEGYHAWEKKLEIKPEKVTEARNILLVLENPVKELATEDKIQGFVFAPDKRKMAYLTLESELVILDVKTEEILFHEKLSQKKTDVGNWQIISWSPDSKKIILKEKIEGLTQFRLLDLDNDLLTSLGPPTKIKELHWHPSQENIILLRRTDPETKKDEILWYNYKDKKSSLPLAEDVASFNISQDVITFIQKSSGLIFEINLEGTSRKQILPTSLPEIKEAGSSQIQKYGSDIIVIVDGVFYITDYENKNFKKLGENIVDARFSSLGKSLLFWSDNEIWVYYLQDILLQPFRHKGDRELITRFGEKIGEVLWYPEDNEHIIFRKGAKIKIIELDGRDRRNAVDFIYLINNEDEAVNTVITYNQSDEYLYFMENNNLYRVKIK